MARFGILVVCLVWLVGCSTPQHTFVFATTYSQEKNTPDFSSFLNYHIELADIQRKETSNNWLLSFSLEVENKGQGNVMLRPAEYFLMDDEGREFRLLAVENDLPSTGVPLAAKTKANWKFKFVLPAQYNLSYIGSLRFAWQLEHKNQTYSLTSKFLRYNVEYRVREVYYPNYPHYWHYPPYWYYPHYDPYPYHHHKSHNKYHKYKK